MHSAGTYPFSVESIEIADVERVKNTASLGGESQLLRIRLPYETGVQHGHHRHATRAKCRGQIAVHRVLIDINLKLAHGCGSVPVLLLQSVRLSHFGFQVGVDLRLIGVIVGQGRMYLRQR